jgi:hypothetical protein
MRTTLEILDAVKRRHSITSDYQLAKLLGKSTSGVSNYRCGRSHLDDLTAVRCAELLDESPLKLIAIVQAERTKRPEEKRKWEEIAKVALFASALISGDIFAPAPARAGARGALPVYTLCVRRGPLGVPCPA